MKQEQKRSSPHLLNGSKYRFCERYPSPLSFLWRVSPSSPLSLTHAHYPRKNMTVKTVVGAAPFARPDGQPPRCPWTILEKILSKYFLPLYVPGLSTAQNPIGGIWDCTQMVVLDFRFALLLCHHEHRHQAVDFALFSVAFQIEGNLVWEKFGRGIDLAPELKKKKKLNDMRYLLLV